MRRSVAKKTTQKLPPRKAIRTPNPRKVAKSATKKAAVQARTPKEAPAPTPKVEVIPLAQPLPIRLSKPQHDALEQKRRQTGVPIQELIRRAVDHMLDTVEAHRVPERTR